MVRFPGGRKSNFKPPQTTVNASRLKLALPALTLLVAGTEASIQAQPPPWARAAQSASRRVAPPVCWVAASTKTTG